MMADRWGRLGRAARAARVVHPCAEMTPRKSHRPAHVACSGGSLTPPGPQSRKMTANKASCLPGHSIRRTHFSPQTLRTSLFLPGTQSSWPRGVFLPGHQTLNCPPSQGLQPSPLLSLLGSPRFSERASPFGFEISEDMGSSWNFRTTQKSTSLCPTTCCLSHPIS